MAKKKSSKMLGDYVVVLSQTLTRSAQIRIKARNEDEAEKLVLKMHEEGKIDEREWSDDPHDDDVTVLDVIEEGMPKRTKRSEVIT